MKFVFSSLAFLALLQTRLFISEAHGDAKLSAHTKILRAKKIVGGYEAPANFHTYMVGIRKMDDTSQRMAHQCGGTLISSKVVLTAAHCLESDLNPNHYDVIAGDWDNTVTEGTEQQLKITRFHVYPKYQVNHRLANNDVAIIELKNAVTLNDFVTIASLPKRDFFNGRMCTIHGWGATNPNGEWESFPSRLRAAQVVMYNRTACARVAAGSANQRDYGSLPRSSICVGYPQGGIDSCSGDSGGALMCQDSDGISYVTGVLSWGACGGQNSLSVYMKVASFVDWIETTMNGVNGKESGNIEREENKNTTNIMMQSLLSRNFFSYEAGKSMTTLWLPSLLITTFFLIISTQDVNAQRIMRHFCSGSANSKALSHGPDRFEDLRQIYQNCTRIFGNVEITHLSSSDLRNRTIDIFDDIEEVTGYIMIYNTDLERISLKKLKIIWGDKLVEDSVAMYVEMNSKLAVISMPSLRSIEKGVVSVRTSHRLCHMKDTVNPDEILNFDRNRYFKSVNVDRYCSKKKATCHPSCNGACWGPGEEDCQSVYRCDNCESKQCYSDVQTNKTRCCHEQCSAGCTGPTAADCTYCANFKQCLDKNQDCRCVDQCTSLWKYNGKTDRVEPNPDGYYSVDNRWCEKACPAKRLAQGDFCVIHCGPGMYYDRNRGDRTCRKCDGPCPKSCRFEKVLDSETIVELQNCTEIEGFIKINPETFSAHRDHVDGDRDIPAMEVRDLDVLKSVRFISDYVYIATGDSPLKSLDFLENLESIEGRRLYDRRQALVVAKNDNLELLGLRKLKRIDNGYVLITRNKQLCHADSFNWRELVAGANTIVSVGENREDCSQIQVS